jgi:hypothetical protein
MNTLTANHVNYAIYALDEGLKRVRKSGIESTARNSFKEAWDKQSAIQSRIVGLKRTLALDMLHQGHVLEFGDMLTRVENEKRLERNRMRMENADAALIEIGKRMMGVE